MAGPRSSGDILQTLTPDVVFQLRVLKDGSYQYYSGKELTETLRSVTQLTKKVADATLKVSKIDKQFSDTVQSLASHLETRGNPHGLSKDDLGLNLVENLGPAPIDEASTGLALAGDVHRFAFATFLPRDYLFPNKAVVIGQEAGHYGGSLGDSVLIGSRAGRGGVAEFVNYVAIGADTHPVASQTVSIGHSRDRFVMPKDVVVRADKRDFTDFKDLTLGLDFVMLLKPQLARMDLREDYIDYASMPLPPEDRTPPPAIPQGDDRNPIYHKAWAAYREAMIAWQRDVDKPYQEGLAAWRVKYREWQKNNRLSQVKPDGTHAHADHQAVILADDLLNAANILKADLTGVIHFKDEGGLDVVGSRSSELIPVLINAIHELHDYIHSSGFVDHLVGKMLKKGQQGHAALRMARRSYENAQKEIEQERLAHEANQDEAEASPVDEQHP